MKMYDSKGRLNFYVAYNINLRDFKKYGRLDNFIGEASYQTDLLCFIMMIIETISNNEKIVNISLDDFFKYLDYLDKLGFNSELLNVFSYIYDDSKPNISPLPYLDYLKETNKNMTYKNFLKNKSLTIRPKL